MSFVLTACPPPLATDDSIVADIDGNTYTTVTIGTQVWMAENLKTTKYRDGTSIPNVTDNLIWDNLTTPAYCWFNNDAATYKTTYGALYNWYTINTGKLCPTGWHNPSEAECRTLASFLGGSAVAGGKLKEVGTSHWLSPNTGATNETGFNAIGTGDRDNGGVFTGMGRFFIWWNTDAYSTTTANGWGLWNDTAVLAGEGSSGRKQAGLPVRCIKD